ncbi:hypothetical protein M8C21_011746, partial [Ambrosia artemisiifolia]
MVFRRPTIWFRFKVLMMVVEITDKLKRMPPASNNVLLDIPVGHSFRLNESEYV